jgi:hypothetical protein
MRNVFTAAIALCTAAVVTACAEQSGGEDAPRAGRDSAGIRIVENTVPLWTDATRWQLDDKPMYEVGAAVDGNQSKQFGYIASVHRFGDTIVVLDAWAPRILFFDKAGALIGRAGRRGSGPGELPARGVQGAFACADSLYVQHGQSISVFQRARFIRTFPLMCMARRVGHPVRAPIRIAQTWVVT